MKKKPAFTASGIPSLVLIFSVLCLVILALLTLGTSRNDLQMSRLSMEQTEKYYAACSRAAGRIAAIAETSRNKETHTVNFYESIDEKQSLYVELEISPSGDTASSPVKITAWRTEYTGEWTPDTKQPVFKGENND